MTANPRTTPCKITIYIFTRCLYFKSPTGSSKYCTTRKNIQRYYTPKRPLKDIYIYYLALLKLPNYVFYDVSAAMIHILVVFLAAHTSIKYLMVKNQP